ncbi:hypothetical protein [Zoogloea sp.]|uniref:MORN repeat-containing protein n=1 Tax=Zoogloea sp. TaxID=49181 RepID=UPI002635CAF7|nr:hypothetical protein [Zoogloea sp.]MDD3352522.1 hypothetical protein [Zoogloea sp.]
MNRMIARGGLTLGLMLLSPLAIAQQADGALMPETADAATAAGCPVLFQEAEGVLERGLQASATRRWKEAVPLLREAGNSLLKIAAGCPEVAIQANRRGDRATAELRLAEVALAHQTECLPRLDKALDLDLKVAMARGDKGDPVEVERLLGEAESTWRDAVSLCQPPHREKAERSLAATIKVRAANAELLSAGPACDAAWKSATALVDFARGAWKDKRWDDAAMLYGKAVMAWEGAADKCLGNRQQQAHRKAEQTQIDAHNAEYCGPLWDAATEQAQRIKTHGAGVAAAEKDQMSIRAEVAWRDAVSACRGTPQNLARSNADALARERGTPLPAQAMAQFGSGKAVPPAPQGGTLPPAGAAVPAAALAAAAVSVPASSGASPGAAAGAARSVEQRPASRPAVAPAVQAEPAVTPLDTVTVAGDATYRGNFSVVSASGEVSGTGTVEWANGERFAGTLVKGLRQGKGRFTWTNGQWYEGDWVEDKATGHGTIQFPGGNRYDGAVLEGQPQGRGTLVFATGERYTGDFVRGVFHGRGSYFWKNGNRYEGAWVLGRKHGQGRLISPEGDAWEGEFKDDQKTDQGREVEVVAGK